MNNRQLSMENRSYLAENFKNMVSGEHRPLNIPTSSLETVENYDFTM
jgi:hypothetical protein